MTAEQPKISTPTPETTPDQIPEKSQSELRSELREHLFTYKPKIEVLKEKYKESLSNGTFDDSEEDEYGAGQQRKLDLQNKITSVLNKAQKVKDRLDDTTPLTIDDVPSAEKGNTTLEKALEIMGTENIIGPEDIQNTFGFEPIEVPNINFTTGELERAKELNQHLILYIDKKEDGTPFVISDIKEILNNKTSDGEKLLYADDPWYTKEEEKISTESPRLGWRLTTPEIIADSTSKNYLDQTQQLITYLTDEVYEDTDIPTEVQEAIDEFNTQKDEISSLISSDWKTAAKKLSNLQINQILREQSSEIIYRLALTESKTKEKNLNPTYSWSNSVDSSGELVFVGFFGSDGVLVSGWRPGVSRGGLGVCFSRS